MSSDASLPRYPQEESQAELILEQVTVRRSHLKNSLEMNLACVAAAVCQVWWLQAQPSPQCFRAQPQWLQEGEPGHLLAKGVQSKEGCSPPTVAPAAEFQP